MIIFDELICTNVFFFVAIQYLSAGLPIDYILILHVNLRFYICGAHKSQTDTRYCQFESIGAEDAKSPIPRGIR